MQDHAEATSAAEPLIAPSHSGSKGSKASLRGNPERAMSDSSVGVGSSSSSWGELRYTRFSIAGFRGEKHAIFVPDSALLSATTVEHICAALGKEMPHATLCGVSSIRHPRNLATPQLQNCAGFQDVMREVRRNLGLEIEQRSGWSCLGLCDAKHGDGHPRVAARPGQQQALQEFANSVLEGKLIGMATAIVTAAKQTNTWIYTGPTVSNFEILLQRASESTNIDAFKVVAAHMQDRAYMECKTSKDMFQELYNRSQFLSPHSVGDSDTVHLGGDLWNRQRNDANREFHEHGYEQWSFNSHDSPAANGHPVTAWPWPCADCFFLFYREDHCGDVRGGNVDWSFITEKRFDHEVIPFWPEKIGPPAFMFIGGDRSTKSRLVQTLHSARPTIIVDNTPNSSKQMSLLVGVIMKALDRAGKADFQPFLPEDAFRKLPAYPRGQELLQALAPSKLLRYIEHEYDISGMESSMKLTLSEVVGLIDLARQKPHLFKENMKILDPLHDTPEQMVLKFQQLSSASSGVHQVNVNESANGADRRLVVKGWRLHSRSVRKASHFQRLAIGMVIIIAVVMLACMAMAATLVSIRLQRERLNQELLVGQVATEEVDRILSGMQFSKISDTLNVWMLVLPITAGLLTTMQSHFQFSQQWSTSYMAGSHVVAEIYQFLGGVGRYAVPPDRRRERFLQRLHEIVAGAAVAGMREDDAVSGEDAVVDNLNDPDVLLSHINVTLYGTHAPGFLAVQMRKLLSGSTGWEQVQNQGQDHDRDPAKPFSVHRYMETRVVPLTKFYERWGRFLTRLRTQLSVAILLLLGFAACLATLGHYNFIPVTIGAATFLRTLLNWLCPSETIWAIDRGLARLHNLDLRWHGANFIDQQSETMKARVVTTTEAVMLAVAATAAQLPIPLDSDGVEEEEADPEWGVVAEAPQHVSVSPRNSGRSSHSASHPASPGGRRLHPHPTRTRVNSTAASPRFTKRRDAWM